MNESPVFKPVSTVEHLDSVQLERLMEAFRLWSQSAPSRYIQRVRGRYWLAFQLLRFTGARIGEILKINDITDIDYRSGEISISGTGPSTGKRTPRTIPVPVVVVDEILAYVSDFPVMKGKVFALDQGNFRREFYRRAAEAEIPRDKSHPHILRHTRAVEMLRADVPLILVQTLLGHAFSSTTALYLAAMESGAIRILRDRGLL